MSKVIDSTMTTHLAGAVTSLAMCWQVTRTDGVSFYFTSHDADLVIGGNTYEASSGFQSTAMTNDSTLAVSNLQVTGILDSDVITQADLAGGKYNYAAIWVFLVNWQDLTQGIIKQKKGRLGEVVLPNTGMFSAELRGLTQQYAQGIVDLYGPDCSIDLGSTKCGIPIAPAVRPAVPAAFALGDKLRVATAAGTGWETFQNVYYECTTAGSLAVAVSGTLDITSVIGAYNFAAMAWSADGTKIYTIDWNYMVHQFTVGTPGDINTATDSGLSYDASAVISNPQDLQISADGTKLYIAEYTCLIHQFTMATPGNCSTLSSDSVSLDVTAQMSGGSALGSFALKPDGSKVYVGDFYTGKVYQYTVATPLNFSTATYASLSFDASAQTTHLQSIRISTDGKNLYLGDYRTGIVYQNAIGTAWAINTAAYAGKNFDTSAQVGSDDLYSIGISADGYKLYMATDGDNFYQYPLTVDFAVTSIAAAAVTYDPTVGHTTTDGTAVFTARNAWTRSGVVATVTDRSHFTVTLTEPRAVDGWFNYGVIQWDTGNNAGVSMEVKTWTQTGAIVELFLGMGFDIQAGDKFGMYAGCDMLRNTCRDKFANINNFRGFPDVPGNNQVLSIAASR